MRLLELLLQYQNIKKFIQRRKFSRNVPTFRIVFQNTDSQSQTANSTQEQPKRRSKNLRVGRKVIPYTMVRTYTDAIRTGEYLDIVKEGLEEYNLIIECFVNLCEKLNI